MDVEKRAEQKDRRRKSSQNAKTKPVFDPLARNRDMIPTFENIIVKRKS